MEERLAELEIRLSFQEQTLTELNDVVVRQAGEIAQLMREIEVLKDRMKAAMPSNIASQAEETPPPHY